MVITELIEALRWAKKDYGDLEVAVEVESGRARVVNLFRETEVSFTDPAVDKLVVATREPVYGTDGPRQCLK